jgi:hypothetical protein
MAVTPTPIYAQTPYATALSFASANACTTRLPTVTASLAAANIVQFTASSVNVLRVDAIRVQHCPSVITASSVANLVQVWEWDGTTAFLVDEISVTAVTPSTTTAAFSVTQTYNPPMIIPAANRLYGSVTVATATNTTALAAYAFGGAY